MRVSTGLAARFPAARLPAHAFGGAEGRRSMFIEVHATPNINSLKFHPGRSVLKEGTMDFPNARASMKSPLAKALFRIDGVSAVFFGPDFVTVTKSSDDISWGEMKPEIFSAMMDFFASGAEVVDEDANLPSDTAILDDDSEIVALIKELLDTRIRPAVQDDGGDINFVDFDEDTGVVTVQLQGACSTCSSSKVTLKSGVENMLMHYVPEVTEVVAMDTEEDENDPVVKRQKEFVEQMTNSAGEATYKTPAC
eukprot:Tamp_11096.p1 GENE.Tamp_11096~~Tamp_11096.p1  ORF type:complete len:252 (+),score=53.46 Tamp_11096:1-756(+)